MRGPAGPSACSTSATGGRWALFAVGPPPCCHKSTCMLSTPQNVGQEAAHDSAEVVRALKGVNDLLSRQAILHGEIEKLKQANPSSPELSQRDAALKQVAATIRIVVKHFQAPEDSRFAAARGNLNKLLDEKKEAEQQCEEQPTEASPEAKQKVL